MEGLEVEESNVGKNLQRNRIKPKMQWTGPTPMQNRVQIFENGITGVQKVILKV